MNRDQPLLEDWVQKRLADPVSKQPSSPDSFTTMNGVIDARVRLPNTAGFLEWESGQEVYENWSENSDGYGSQVQKYLEEIEYDRPVYEKFLLEGDIIDVGGGVGTVREFLDMERSRLVVADPFIEAPFKIPNAKREAYSCLETPLNFLSAAAEFLPFSANSFDWVHMRSMLDHVQVPDLALLEANRVLKDGGSILIGLYVEGGKNGRMSFTEWSKDVTRNHLLPLVGVKKWVDHHTWHPTFDRLKKLITDANFEIDEIYWQPHWNDRVVYIKSHKRG